MGILDRYGRGILILLFVLSVVIMAYSLWLEITEGIFFFALTNTILIFRLCGVSCVTTTVHVIGFILIFVSLIYVQTDIFNFNNVWMLIVPLAVLFVISLHMMCCRPGRCTEERACRSTFHALFANIVTIIYFWDCCFLVRSQNEDQCLAEIFYMLLFLFMILTPHLQSQSQAWARIRNKDCCPKGPRVCPMEEERTSKFCMDHPADCIDERSEPPSECCIEERYDPREEEICCEEQRCQCQQGQDPQYYEDERCEHMYEPRGRHYRDDLNK